MSIEETILKQQRDAEKILEPLRHVEKILEPRKLAEKMLEPMKHANKMVELANSIEPMQRIIREQKERTDMFRGIVDRSIVGRDDHMQQIMSEIAGARAEAEEAPTARRAVGRIINEMRSFQDELNEDEDVGLQLVAVSHMVISVEDVGYYQPNIIVFYGTINGRPTRLMQHVSQLNFVLTSVPREHPEDERREIGFHVED